MWTKFTDQLPPLGTMLYIWNDKGFPPACVIFETDGKNLFYYGIEEKNTMWRIGTDLYVYAGTYQVWWWMRIKQNYLILDYVD